MRKAAECEDIHGHSGLDMRDKTLELPVSHKQALPKKAINHMFEGSHAGPRPFGRPD
jgi:hypothetical protein